MVFLTETADGGSKLHFLFQTLEEGCILAQTISVSLKKIMKRPGFISILGICGWGLGHEQSIGLQLKKWQWNKEKGFLSLCMIFTLILSISQTVKWILLVHSSGH